MVRRPVASSPHLRSFPYSLDRVELLYFLYLARVIDDGHLPAIKRQISCALCLWVLLAGIGDNSKCPPEWHG